MFSSFACRAFTTLFLGCQIANAQIFNPVPPEKPQRFCSEHTAWLHKAESEPEWEELKKGSGLSVRLPYASFQNITGHDLYCGTQRAFLHKDAARKLYEALSELRRQHPGYGLLIFDGARPYHAQRELYKVVRGTRWQKFVASPDLGSVHSYGMAVDLTITDAQGRPLDMGTTFDAFTPYSGKAGESQALRDGTLTREQIRNRELLREIMRHAGFKRLDHEWWHFNAEVSRVVRKWYDQL